MENPEWYTPYTPYQPEIAQGKFGYSARLQCLIYSMYRASGIVGQLSDDDHVVDIDGHRERVPP